MIGVCQKGNRRLPLRFRPGAAFVVLWGHSEGAIGPSSARGIHARGQVARHSFAASRPCGRALEDLCVDTTLPTGKRCTAASGRSPCRLPEMSGPAGAPSREESARMEYSVRWLPGSSLTDEELKGPLVSRLSECAAEVLGTPPPVAGIEGFCDMYIFQQHFGVPAVIWGALGGNTHAAVRAAKALCCSCTAGAAGRGGRPVRISGGAWRAEGGGGFCRVGRGSGAAGHRHCCRLSESAQGP
jgi:hypothetical protein